MNIEKRLKKRLKKRSDKIPGEEIREEIEVLLGRKIGSAKYLYGKGEFHRIKIAQLKFEVSKLSIV